MRTFACAAVLALGLTSPALAAHATPACDVAAHYVQVIQEGRYGEVGNLFADNAIFYNPQGRILRGRPAITAFYTSFLSAATPIVRAARFAEDRARGVCVMELETRMRRDELGRWSNAADGDYSLSAIDRMTVNPAGKIEHMVVYLAPPGRWQGE